MEIRTIISELKQFIKLSSKELEAKLPALAQQVLEQIAQYDAVEQSRQRRIELLQELSTDLRSLANRISETKNFFRFLSKEEKLLWQAIYKTESAKQRQDLFFLYKSAIAIYEIFLELVANSLYSSIKKKTIYQIKESAFRILNNLSLSETCLLDSRLDGVPPGLCLQKLIDDLYQFISIFSKKAPLSEIQTLENCLAQLQFGEKIAHRQFFLRCIDNSWLFTQKEQETQLADLSYEVEKKAAELRIGQGVMVPGGYRNDKGSHAVAFEIQRTGAHSYRFILYNTGDGATTPLSWWQSTKTWWNCAAPSIAFENLSFSSITNQKFLMEILNCMVKRTEGIKKIFELLQTHLEQEGGATQTFLQSHPLQTWGTCAFDSILAYLRAKLPSHVFEEFQHFLAEKAATQLPELITKARQEGCLNQNTLDLIDRKAREILAAA